MKFISKVEDVTCAVALFASTAVLFVNVVSRYVFHAGFSWSEELIRYLVVFVSFMALGGGIRKGLGIRIDVISQLSSERVKRKVDFLGDLAEAFFLVVALVLTGSLVVYTRNLGQTTPSTDVPMYVPYLGVFAGLLLSSVDGVVKVAGYFRRKGRE